MAPRPKLALQTTRVSAPGRAPVTEGKENVLVLAHAEHGNEWEEISKYLPTRSPNSIKNRWNSTVRAAAPNKKTASPPDTPRTLLYLYVQCVVINGEGGDRVAAAQQALALYTAQPDPPLPLDAFAVEVDHFKEDAARACPAYTDPRREVHIPGQGNDRAPVKLPLRRGPAAAAARSGAAAGGGDESDDESAESEDASGGQFAPDADMECELLLLLPGAWMEPGQVVGCGGADGGPGGRAAAAKRPPQGQPGSRAPRKVARGARAASVHSGGGDPTLQALLAGQPADVEQQGDLLGTRVLDTASTGTANGHATFCTGMDFGNGYLLSAPPPFAPTFLWDTAAHSSPCLPPPMPGFNPGLSATAAAPGSHAATAAALGGASSRAAGRSPSGGGAGSGAAGGSSTERKRPALHVRSTSDISVDWDHLLELALTDPSDACAGGWGDVLGLESHMGTLGAAPGMAGLGPHPAFGAAPDAPLDSAIPDALLDIAAADAPLDSAAADAADLDLEEAIEVLAAWEGGGGDAAGGEGAGTSIFAQAQQPYDDDVLWMLDDASPPPPPQEKRQRQPQPSRQAGAARPQRAARSSPSPWGLLHWPAPSQHPAWPPLHWGWAPAQHALPQPTYAGSCRHGLPQPSDAAPTVASPPGPSAVRVLGCSTAPGPSPLRGPGAWHRDPEWDELLGPSSPGGFGPAMAQAPAPTLQHTWQRSLPLQGGHGMYGYFGSAIPAMPSRATVLPPQAVPHSLAVHGVGCRLPPCTPTAAAAAQHQRRQYGVDPAAVPYAQLGAYGVTAPPPPYGVAPILGSSYGPARSLSVSQGRRLRAAPYAAGGNPHLHPHPQVHAPPPSAHVWDCSGPASLEPAGRMQPPPASPELEAPPLPLLAAVENPWFM